MAKLGGKRSGTIIFDDLAFKLTPSERIVFGIIHRFSGYALGECRLKPTKIAEIAGVSRSTVYNVTKRLRSLGMIETVTHIKASGGSFTAFKVKRDSLSMKKMSADDIEQLERENLEEQRHSLQAGELIVDEAMNIPDYVIDELAEKIPTNAVRILNENAHRHGDSTVNELFAFWIQEVATPLTNRVKANRRAAWNLAKKHGVEPVKQMVQVAKLARYNDFAPHVADFVDLQSKWQQLSLWAEKRAHASLMKKYEALSIEDRIAFKQSNPELAKIIDKKRESF